jgi:hypothetical protein
MAGGRYVLWKIEIQGFKVSKGIGKDLICDSKDVKRENNTPRLVRLSIQHLLFNQLKFEVFELDSLILLNLQGLGSLVWLVNKFLAKPNKNS